MICYSFRPNAIPLGENLARALEDLGHEVIRFDSHPDETWMPGRKLLKTVAKAFGAKARVAAYFEDRENRRQAAKFLARVRTSRPDTVIVIRGERIPLDAVDACSSLGVRKRVVWWVKNPRWQHALREEAPHFDAAFSIDGTLAGSGIRALPSWALQADVFFADHRKKSRTIVFVGAHSDRRQQFLEALAGLPLTIIGPGWATRLPLGHPLRTSLGEKWLSGERLADVYREAYVVIDTHQIEQTTGQGTNMRYADVPACGALLLTEPALGIADWFVPDKHIAIYTSVAELREKATYFAANPARAEEMGRAAAEQAKRLPTFADRARALLDENA